MQKWMEALVWLSKRSDGQLPQGLMQRRNLPPPRVHNKTRVGEGKPTTANLPPTSLARVDSNSSWGGGMHFLANPLNRGHIVPNRWCGRFGGGAQINSPTAWGPTRQRRTKKKQKKLLGDDLSCIHNILPEAIAQGWWVRAEG